MYIALFDVAASVAVQSNAEVKVSCLCFTQFSVWNILIPVQFHAVGHASSLTVHRYRHLSHSFCFQSQRLRYKDRHGSAFLKEIRSESAMEGMLFSAFNS